ncbi:hypothetical protein SAMN04487962_13313 [Marinobacter segnicrescens]|uniref:Uncharacterized protein n=1 Tax=Marinobacter segnicrescens TaxID=430453 RepID=A0A1I0HRB3_9GAMM|nr:hypothetical protein [Marinobacter segnicrescens]SET86548.1 hypothetical protein SAMN04487962_13313 [Marinobacter segnicrescens]
MAVMTNHDRIKEVLRRQQATEAPLNIEWLQLATQLPGRTLHLALALAVESYRRQTATVSLKARELESYGVKPDAASVGLDRLVQAGLVFADRHQGRPAQITINVL